MTAIPGARPSRRPTRAPKRPDTVESLTAEVQRGHRNVAEAEGIVAAAESGRLRADAELMATFRHNADCCRAELAKAERKLKRIVQ